jgi:hypothetical protein
MLLDLLGQSSRGSAAWAGDKHACDRLLEYKANLLPSVQNRIQGRG